MAPTSRLERTDTIANLADFGAIEGNPLSASANAAAFRAAFTAFGSGLRRLVIPAGTWYFQEILYLGNQWLPANVEIFGLGRERTVLRYTPTAPNALVPAFRFPAGLSRGIVRDLQLVGPVSRAPNQSQIGTGISLLTSHLNSIRDVEIWYFATGIDFGTGFSGYNAVERFEINGCTTGIRMRDGSNGALISSGRINGSIDQSASGSPLTYTAETGVGIDIEGTNGSSGPGGASGVVISAVQIEETPLCLRVVRSHDIAVLGCYLEPGNRPTPNTILGARRVSEIDDVSERVALVGTVQSEPIVTDPMDPIASQDRTPVYVTRPPEARGVVDLDGFHPTGASFTNNVWGASQNGATAAHGNRLKNGDMSRGLQFWSLSPGYLAGNVVETTLAPDYVIGERSLVLTSTPTSTHHIFQDFRIDAGIRSITAVVRYRVVPAASAAFRVELATVTGAVGSETITTIGYYSDTDAVSTGWRVRSLMARFDGTLSGLQGPRRFRVRVYPHNVDGLGVAGRQVVLDSAWLVDGEYATPYRGYADGIEVLSGNDRVALFSGTNVAAAVGPTGIPGAVRIPANAVGMVNEISITGTQASTTATTLSVDDNLGTDDTRVFHAFVSNRPTVVEYTVPLVSSSPGVVAGSNVQWSVSGASGANLVTYAVRLKAWVIRA